MRTLSQASNFLGANWLGRMNCLGSKMAYCDFPMGAIIHDANAVHVSGSGEDGCG